ncbi:hypothetical protein BIFBRE_04105 [Bifidobacterium breve DSM 20213 = JCM 1192]|uniref:Uncharacterized protein n=1 Tax=Bifidobacterium breve DSM 20213 = JCM 1192 TaxID=518634 RepID=D4BPU0_BIFBR|nr:hypothetical protein BIFBRE_04105 [Bifidobacterium breve DSM 20213 = JCM 1192]
MNGIRQLGNRQMNFNGSCRLQSQWFSTFPQQRIAPCRAPPLDFL